MAPVNPEAECSYQRIPRGAEPPAPGEASSRSPARAAPDTASSAPASSCSSIAKTPESRPVCFRYRPHVRRAAVLTPPPNDAGPAPPHTTRTRPAFLHHFALWEGHDQFGRAETTSCQASFRGPVSPNRHTHGLNMAPRARIRLLCVQTARRGPVLSETVGPRCSKRYMCRALR